MYNFVQINENILAFVHTAQKTVLLFLQNTHILLFPIYEAYDIQSNLQY